MTAPPDQRDPNPTFVQWWATVGHTLEAPSLGETIRPEPSSSFGSSIPTLPPREGAPAVQDLGALLGEGGAGRVMEGTQASMGRRVAVKEPRAAAPSAGVVQQLLMEAWITGGLEHPNVVPVYDISTTSDGRPQILMKQIAGTHWGALIADPEEVRRRFGVQDALAWHLQIFTQVCNAVHFAHSRGLIHRDIKPENVMVGTFGEVYLLDWGLAAAIDDQLPRWIPRASALRQLAGTPNYMAPEMLPGEAGGLSAQTDVYLLGATLYEIVTGAPPHLGDDLESILFGIPGFVPALGDDVPAPLAALIRSTLSYAPEDRPPDADALRRLALRFLETRDGEAIAGETRVEISALRAALAQASPPREHLYEHLAAARFGLERARDRLDDAGPLAAALDDAALALARWELSEGRPDAAALLNQGASTPDPALAEAIGAARARQDRDRRQLDDLRIDRSARVGVRTRLTITGLALLSFVGHPFVAMASPHLMTYTSFFIHSAVFFLALVGLGIWGRDSMSRTALNRRSFEMLILLPLAQGGLDLTAFLNGLPVETAFLFRMPLWTTLIGAFGLLVERRVLPSAVLFGGLSLAAATRPEQALLLSAIGAVGLTLNLAASWAPLLPRSIDARTLPPKEERR